MCEQINRELWEFRTICHYKLKENILSNTKLMTKIEMCK